MSNLIPLTISDGTDPTPVDWVFTPVFNDGKGTVRLEALVDGRPDLSKKLTLKLTKNVQPGNMTRVSILLQEPTTKLVDGEDVYDGYDQGKTEFLFRPNSTVADRTAYRIFFGNCGGKGEVAAYVKDLDAMI